MSLDKKQLAPRANLGLVYTAAEQWRNAAHHLGRAVEMDDGLASSPVRSPPSRSSCERSNVDGIGHAQAFAAALAAVESATCAPPAAEVGARIPRLSPSLVELTVFVPSCWTELGSGGLWRSGRRGRAARTRERTRHL